MENYKIKTTVRRALGAAPEGMCVGIADYSAQEGRIVACVAGIVKLIEGFFTEVKCPFLINPHTGKEFANPDSDMHLSAALAMYPELQLVPKWEVLAESKKDVGGYKRRDRGKVLGFTLIYGGNANRISSALLIEKEQAQQLLDNYFVKFPELLTYIETVSTKAKYQGWIECPMTNRRYFVRESNAKGLNDDNTVQRKACNTLIQGSAAIMTKKAMWYKLCPITK